MSAEDFKQLVFDVVVANLWDDLPVTVVIVFRQRFSEII